MPATEYNIGCYLLDRLAQLGCGHLFGVPGDYNLLFLDDVEACPEIEWVGCANELNAAYAADGYARIRRIGAVLTTYGVGELSALNGIAGAAAERNPVVHIVGGPALAAAEQRKFMHHTLGDGDFHNFSKMSEQISCAVARLTPENALAEIDRVLTETMFHKKPGFILLPMDVAMVPAHSPSAKLELRRPQLSTQPAEAFAKAVNAKLSAAKNPALLVGHLCDRYLCKDAAQRLVVEGNIPFADMYLGRAALDCGLPNYLGCYYGAPTPDSVKNTIEGADVCVLLGTVFHDFGTSSYSHQIDMTAAINIQPFESSVDGQVFADVPMANAIEIVTEAAKRHCSAWPTDFPAQASLPAATETAFSQHHFWSEIQASLEPGDIFVVDQGTSSVAGYGLKLPGGVDFIVQCLWGSIGYSLPAAFGAQVAAPDRRVVLVIGDGAAQMTVQEFGSFERYHLHPLIFVVNNDGYVIERVIHGWNKPYNDIASWKWCTILHGMCPNPANVIKTIQEPGSTVQAFHGARGTRNAMHLYEVILGRHERPVITMAFGKKK